MRAIANPTSAIGFRLPITAPAVKYRTRFISIPAKPISVANPSRTVVLESNDAIAGLVTAPASFPRRTGFKSM